MASPRSGEMTTGVRVVRLVSALSTVLVAVPALAHLFELPGKIAMPAADYYVVQRIYRGWALFGIPIVVAIVSTAACAWLLRADRRACRWTLAALALLVLTQVVYWSFTEPANRATSSWTVLTPDFEHVRRSWELSHACNAVLNSAAVVALVVAMLPVPVAVRDRAAP